jgi:hypothetical protein
VANHSHEKAWRRCQGQQKSFFRHHSSANLSRTPADSGVRSRWPGARHILVQNPDPRLTIDVLYLYCSHYGIQEKGEGLQAIIRLDNGFSVEIAQRFLRFASI